jgi:outer membrane lipoprotein SlyB
MNILKRLYILFPIAFCSCTGMRSGGDSDTGLYPGAATVAGSTVVGAGTGAAIGALAGPPGAAIGAVAGAAAGAGVGLGVNAANKQNQSYLVAPRDPVNRNYVINPYNKNEKLYVKDASEGKVMRDPVGRTYVVGP